MNRLFSASIDRQVWRRFVQSVRNFARGASGTRAKLMLATLIGLSVLINGLNVVNSYVGRDFFTSIEQKSMSGFVAYALLYVGVFAASTVVAVLFRFAEERLGLLWREWLTRDLVEAYVEHPTFYRLNDYVVENGEITNPDQRITDDVRAFTTTTLSFFLLILNASFTVFAFSGVMWSISPRLFLVGVVYAALGSVGAVWFGHPLVGLNSKQFDREAELRSELIHLREHAESVALARNETLLKSRLLRRIDDVIGNARHMIAVNRDLGFFVTGYNYMIQIIPALIVAPMFIRGHAQFGEIAQSAMAFTQLLGAFSLIVTQFQSISSFTAIVGRLGSFAEAIEQAQSVGLTARQVCDEHAGPECSICLPELSPVHGSMAIKVHDDDDAGIMYDKLTLRSGQDASTLLHELTVTIPHGLRVLVLGQNQAAKTALFRATAGMWDVGEGWVLRPGPERMAFLPERPYLPRGSLRDLLERPWQPLDEQRLQGVLESLGLDTLLARVRSLDHEHDWSELLSLGEQQTVSFARILLAGPRFVFLDRPVTVLGVAGVDRLLRALHAHSITYLTICESHDLRRHHDAVLEVTTDGTWRWQQS